MLDQIKIDSAMRLASEESIWLLKKNALLLGLVKLAEKESPPHAPKVRNFV